ncbi:LacI family transcriptional regulator [Glycomyces sp. TRM65418]|uniref:LacI family DNA-binding transcriptional regulator n=1 Tax=Glycomyces sp. TRM65418 TaxID=2867006 RepID=UPI001CE68F1B|nr:LacI family DNA-binding transcriptional regulator [Glycomyces sp. TRM65418]MCC3765844.1 LacI family transcriptional regulator [Glycomyces sp. TRM65418]QZD55430.1 LacI family transcriptional regulator [Glycomyces sp. TRM65418]
MTAPRRRVTQRDIARLSGVSQATVSVVLNNRLDVGVRIAPETRERVLDAIRETGYVADPVARRLADQYNRIIGVFTYEPVFPSGTRDFYHPFLVGLEERAERLGFDLLLLTSAPVEDGRRRMFAEGSRIRLADGCVLLGQEVDRDDLARLVAEGIPFVSVGRRDDAGGPVPYVGADYPTATAALVHRAAGLGHRSLAYIGRGAGPESYMDRLRGFLGAAEAAGAAARRLPDAGTEALDAAVADGVTALFLEEPADVPAVTAWAGRRGLGVPADLSLVALGDPTRPVSIDLDVTGFTIPRREMGRQALDVFGALLEGAETDAQRLLPCELHDGATLASPTERNHS